MFNEEYFSTFKPKSNLKIFPNPTLKYFSINLSFPKFKRESLSLKIQTFSGEILFQKNIIIQGTELNEDIDVSSLSKGLYLLTLKSNDGVWTEKIVVY